MLPRLLLMKGKRYRISYGGFFFLLLSIKSITKIKG